MLSSRRGPLTAARDLIALVAVLGVVVGTALLALRQRLLDHSTEVTDVVDHGLMRSIYFTDPNDIALEASWWSDDPTGIEPDFADDHYFRDPNPVAAVQELREGDLRSDPAHRAGRRAHRRLHHSMTDPFEQVAARVVAGSRLVRAWPLAGGISAQTTAIEVEAPDGTTSRFVVRVHSEHTLATDPRAASDEFRLLARLQPTGLPIPSPIHFEESPGTFGRPYIVLELINGTTELAADDVPEGIAQMASTLARIHEVDVDALDLSFLPRRATWFEQLITTTPAELDESTHEPRLREALASACPIPQPNGNALLHGDFWPGNVLWRDGSLVGVIDWEAAAIGDPLIDLAISRLDIACEYGLAAMDAFERHYRQAAPQLDTDPLVLWDLSAALRMGPNIAHWARDCADEALLRTGHELFVQRAFTALAAR